MSREIVARTSIALPPEKFSYTHHGYPPPVVAPGLIVNLRDGEFVVAGAGAYVIATDGASVTALRDSYVEASCYAEVRAMPGSVVDVYHPHGTSPETFGGIRDCGGLVRWHERTEL